MKKGKRWRSILLWAVPLIFFITLKTHRTFSGDGDEPHYLLIAESLIDDHDLNMVNQYPDRHLFIPQLHPPGHTIPDRFGGTFPFHDIGLPVLLIPVLLVTHALVPVIPEHVFNVMRMAPAKLTTTLVAYQSMLVTCILTFLLWIYFRDEGCTEREALWGSWLAVLTLPIATHAYLFFTEIYSATVILACVLLIRHRQRWDLVVFSSLLFVLMWLHARNVLLCGTLAGLWFWNRLQNGARVRAWIPFFVFTIAVLLRYALNDHFLGIPTLSALSKTAGADRNGFSIQFTPNNLIGFAMDRQFGMVWSNPLFLLLPVGLYRAWKHQRNWWTCEALLVVPYIGLLLVYRFWWAGWSPAGRYLVPVMPLLWPPIYGELLHLWHSRAKWLGYILLILSLFVGLVHWQWPRAFWMNENMGINPWMDILTVHGFSWQQFLPSIFLKGPGYALSTLWTTVGFLLVIAVSVWAIPNVESGPGKT